MIFRITLTDVTEALVDDPFFANDPEYLPGNFAITYGNIKKYRRGDDFIVHRIDGDHGYKMNIKNDPDLIRVYNAYFPLWENWHYFNMLPTAGRNGWLSETPWVLDYIKQFDIIFKQK